MGYIYFWKEQQHVSFLLFLHPVSTSGLRFVMSIKQEGDHFTRVLQWVCTIKPQGVTSHAAKQLQSFRGSKKLRKGLVGSMYVAAYSQCQQKPQCYGLCEV